MTAKEYLGQAYRLDLQITSKAEMLDSLNSLAVRTTGTLSGMPRNPNRDESSLRDIIARIIDLQEEINREIDRLVDLKRELCAVIRAVGNTEYRVLLEKRYISGKSWPEIAVDMNCKMRTVYKLHDLALKAVAVPNQEE